MILVASLAAVPDECTMAALLLGATVAEHVLRPGIRFQRPTCSKISTWTAQFRRGNPAVCQVLDVAPRIKVQGLRPFEDSVVQKEGTSQGITKSHVLLYVAGEADASSFRVAAKRVSRTLPEFVTAFRRLV